MVLALVTSVALAHGSVLKALAMIVLGLLLGSSAPTSTPARRASPSAFLELADGINFVAVAVGVFGIAEILRNLENEHDAKCWREVRDHLMPTREDFKRIVAPIIRGTLLGSVLGICPAAARCCLLRRLHGRKANVHDARALRPRRDRRRCRPESANNAGGADVVHPDADPRHSRPIRSWR